MMVLDDTAASARLVLAARALRLSGPGSAVFEPMLKGASAAGSFPQG
jgi:hypothetical protein